MKKTRRATSGYAASCVLYPFAALFNHGRSLTRYASKGMRCVRAGRRRITAGLLALCVALTILPLSYVSFAVGDSPSLIGQNLIANPGGELGTPSYGSIDLSQNSWIGSNRWYAYDSIGTLTPHGGSYFMACYNPGMSTGTISCYQDIDVSSLSADINANKIIATLTGWLRSSGGNTSKLKIQQLDQYGSPVSALFERSTTVNSWGQVTISEAVLPNTRTLRVTMEGNLTATGAAALDDLSLILSSNESAAPVVSSIAAQSVTTGVLLGPLAFTVTDADTPLSSLTLSVTSSNQTLIPNANITSSLVSGSGTISLTSVAGQTGQADITVAVSDGTKTTRVTFTVTVNTNIAMGVNLVINGDGTSKNGWNDDQSRITSGSVFTVATVPPGSSKYYMTQEIDIAKYAVLFDANLLTFTTGCTLTTGGECVFQGLNAFGTVIWTQNGAATQIIPANTRKILVTVGGSVGGTIDNISFVINTASLPKMTDITDKTLGFGSSGTGALPFTVAYSGSSLTLSAASSNTTLVPLSNISFSGSGYERSVTIAIAQNIVASSIITIYAGSTELDSFIVSVSKASPSVSVSASPASPGTYGNEITLTATLSGGYNPGGTVQFKVGGSNLGSPVAVSAGKASYTYTPSATGDYSYTAVYSGDTSNNTATSSAYSYSVNKANQSALGVSSASTHTFGSTYTASVTGGTTGGTVTYQITGGTGEGSFSGSTLTVTKVGTIIFTAKMAGNDNYNDVTSSAFTLSVSKASPSVSVSASPASPGTYGNEITLTATLSGGYNPGGTVQFKVGGSNLGSPVAVSAGKATYTYTPSATGDYSYTAVYSGDTSNNTATSPAFSYSVNKANQSALGVSSASTHTFGSTYTASVTGGTTGGTVTYQITGGTGEGSFSGSTLTVTKVGTIIFTAKMAGNESYNDVTSSAFTLTVSKAASQINIDDDIEATYSKTAVAGSSDDVTLTGSCGAVSFKYYSDAACENEISAPVSVGTYYFKAVVAADDNYLTATSGARTITISKKQISITGLTVNDKTYDGGTGATVKNAGALAGVETGDVVTISSGTCAFVSQNASDSVSVTASGYGLQGADAGQYSLSAQPSVPAAKIGKAELDVCVSPVTIKTGQSIPSLDVRVTGFVNGETESSLSGYACPSASVSGTVDTTDNTLTSFTVAYSGGNATGNYVFKYNTTAQIEIQSVDVTQDDFEADRDLSAWQKSDITITPKNGYTQISTDKTSWSSSLVISDEGENSVTFYLKKADGTQTSGKNVLYKLDKTAPTGEITIKENGFRSFINFISFGIFCKNTLDIEISGADALGDTAIEYILSADADTTGLSYQSYTGTIHASSKGTYVVTAKITDEAGNEAVIRSDGVVLYEDSEANSSQVTYVKLSGEDKSADVTLNGNTISAVSVGGTALTSGQCTVSGSTITLKGSYLETLAAGDYTVTVSYNPQGYEYDPTDAGGTTTYNGDAPDTTEFTLKIVRKTLTAADFDYSDPAELTYTGAEKTASVSAKTGITGVGAITVKYFSGDSLLTFAPVNAGTYTVKIDVEQGTACAAAADLTLGSFTITNASQSAPVTPAAHDTTTLQNDDGKITGVDDTMEYKKQGDAGFSAISGTEVSCLSNGTYYVRYAAKTNYDESPSLELEIALFEGTAEDKPEATFDAAARTLSGFLPGQKYRVDDGVWLDAAEDLSGVVTGACEIELYMPGDGVYTLDSDIQTISVTKADMPTAGVVNESFAGKNDGQITGLTPAMEYKTETGSYTAITADTLTGLAPGRYYVRVKAAGTVLESDAQELTVLAGGPEFTQTTLPTDSNGVGASGMLSPGAQLVVAPVTSGSDGYAALISLAGANNSVIGIFEISVSGEGFEGGLTLSFTVGAKYNGKTLTIHHQKSGGGVDTYTAVCSDGKVEITVYELSPFVISAPKEAPGTGVASNTALWAVLALISGAGVVAALCCLKKRHEKG